MQSSKISKHGEYRLSKNLTTNGLIIDTSNVTLDLAGYRIKSNVKEFNDFSGIEIKQGVDNVKIINGTIEGFKYGINGKNNDGLTIENIEIKDTKIVGILLDDIKNATIKNSTIDNVYTDINGFAHYKHEAYAIGIQITGDNVILDANTFRDIRRQKSPTDEIGEGVAILIINNSKDIQINKNKIEFEKERIDNTIGIWIGTGSEVTIKNNTILNAERSIATREVFAKIEGNKIYLESPSLKDSYGIFLTQAEAASSVSNNFIKGPITQPLTVFYKEKSLDSTNNVQNNIIEQTDE